MGNMVIARTSNLLVFFLFSCTLFSCSQGNRTSLSVGCIQKELQDVLIDTSKNQIYADTLVRNKESAIKIAEAILCDTYGTSNIKNQRPYEVNYIDGYWALNGTLPENENGGTFLIIIKAANGQVVKMTHGK